MNYTGINCPVCSEPFKEDDDIVVCPKCGAPYHRGCYAESGKCIFPDLHKEKKSWISETGNDKTEQSDPESVVTDDAVICRSCGHKNPKDTVVCEECGDFLFGSVHILRGKRKKPVQDDNDNDQNNDDSEPEYMGGDPFADNSEFSKPGRLYVDGVKVFDIGFGKDEDFDGIKGHEFSEYVGSNCLYYLPLFSSIFRRNKSRFHFAAFLFGGSWYFYRKQYLKGSLLMAGTTVLYAINEVVTKFFANPMWEKAADDIKNGVMTTDSLTSSWMPSWDMYWNWMVDHCSAWEGFLMLLPYILSLISWVIMFICGFNANKGYYNTARKSIKKIKEENPDKSKDETARLISAKGGTSMGLAWMMTAIQAIVIFTVTMIIR